MHILIGSDIIYPDVKISKDFKSANVTYSKDLK